MNIVWGHASLKKGLFIEAGLYDENISYSENSELFIRLVRTFEKLNLNTNSIQEVSFLYNNQYTPGYIEKKLTDKYNTYKYLYEKYSGKGMIDKKVISNFGEINAINPFKKQEVNKGGSLKGLFKAFHQYPWNPVSYLRLVRYVFLA